MPDEHIAARFDRDFNSLASRVMALGGLVEAQTRQAVQALLTSDLCGAESVVEAERQVDRLELEIDRDLSAAFCRRQPKAAELRLLTAMSRTTTNLERVGDEAECIARSVRSLARQPGAQGGLPAGELAAAAELASAQLRCALDAFARLDTIGALAVLRQDRALDQEYGRFLASVGARMATQPDSVASGVGLVLVAKAIERIGDHAKNIAECTIYIVQGADVRHGDSAALAAFRTAQ